MWKSKVKHWQCKEIIEEFLESLDINTKQIIDFPTRGDNAVILLLTNRVSLLNKCCDIPVLTDYQSATLVDIECPEKTKNKNKNQYLVKSISGK